jgi:hypothetical protein
MALDTIIFNITLELSDTASCDVWFLILQMDVVASSKIRQFENRAVHVDRTATLVASWTLWIQPLHTY